MKIYVNGETIDCSKAQTVRGFLLELEITPGSTLLLLNSESICGDALDMELKEGDCLEILRFAGGG